MNFGKTLLDVPIAIKGNKLLPPYEPPKPVPKPRQRKKAPIALPRNRLPMKVREKVKKLIDEISPYYSPEAISQFKKNLKFIQKAEITQRKKLSKIML